MKMKFRHIEVDVKRLIAVALLLMTHLTVSGNVSAQNTSTPTLLPSTDLQIKADDGKALYGSYYALSDSDGPAVLLLHQLYTNRSSWKPLVTPLLNAGFKVLAIDLRGYGQTRGKINWTEAQNDTVAWAAWLKLQPGVQSIAIVGSSMGSNLALIGCLQVDGCKGAVAISPSLDYFGVKTSDAMQAGFPSLIVYADQDRYPKQDVPQMLQLAGDHASTIVYKGRTHGMDLFKEHNDLASQIVSWLQGL